MTLDPLNDGKSRLELIQFMGSDDLVCDAARVSFNKDRAVSVDKDRNSKLIKYMMDHGHTSPFEHCVVTFVVKCPLFVRGQWHRHRTWSYNEVSRRYTEEDMEFYVPKKYRVQDKIINKQGSAGEFTTITAQSIEKKMKKMVDQAVDLFDDLIAMDMAREQARMVLPQNMYVRYYATANLSNIMKFVELRDHSHAQPEIQVYAQAISEICRELFPTTWFHFEEKRSRPTGLEGERYLDALADIADPPGVPQRDPAKAATAYRRVALEALAGEDREMVEDEWPELLGWV